MHTVKLLGIIVAVLSIPILFDNNRAFAQKIDTSLGSFNLAAGASVQVQLQLETPIICPQQAQTCNVVLNLVVSDPSRVGLDTNTVTWNYNEWSQTRIVTVSAIDSPTYSDGQTVTISAVAVSNAVYYSGYEVSMSAIIPTPPAPGLTNQSINIINNGASITTNVLGNATNSPDSSTLSIVSGPSHGTATDPPGTITYIPNKGYIGSDSLKFQVCSSLDNQVCSTGVLSFNVIAPTIIVNGESTPSAPDTGFGKIDNRSIFNELKLLFLSSSLFVIGGVRMILRNSKTT